ncbi:MULTISPECIES: hypothetical protein [unclassified Lacinutrix]
MKKNLLLVFLSILSIQGVFALDTLNIRFYNLSYTNSQGITANKKSFSNNNFIAISTQFIRIAQGLDATAHRLDTRFDFILTAKNKITSFIYYEIIGINIISNTLHLQTNHQSFTNKKPNIFNTLGPVVKTIPLNNTEMHHMNVSNIYKGLYYMTRPNLNLESLKFVKVN